MKKRFCSAALALSFVMVNGCGQTCVEEVSTEDYYVNEVILEEVIIEDEAVALAESPVALPELLLAEATGTKTKASGKAVIDYSNTRDGYVMIQYIGETVKRLKVQVKGPKIT